jgi:hypothetical protein
LHCVQQHVVGDEEGVDLLVVHVVNTLHTPPYNISIQRSKGKIFQCDGRR